MFFEVMPGVQLVYDVEKVGGALVSLESLYFKSSYTKQVTVTALYRDVSSMYFNALEDTGCVESLQTIEMYTRLLHGTLLSCLCQDISNGDDVRQLFYRLSGCSKDLDISIINTWEYTDTVLNCIYKESGNNFKSAILASILVQIYFSKFISSDSVCAFNVSYIGMLNCIYQRGHGSLLNYNLGTKMVSGYRQFANILNGMKAVDGKLDVTGYILLMVEVLESAIIGG